MTTTLTRTGRRAEQRRQRRRRQVRLVGVLLAVLALLAAGFAVYLARDAPAPPAASVDTTRSQRTLLLQVQAVNGTGVANALLAHDPRARSGAAVLVPPQVLVTVPGTGPLPLGQALSRVPPQGSRDALSDLMGVTVDDGWVLDQPALTSLVDALGGISADVDVPVVQGQSVVLSRGRQQLDGAGAVTLLTFLAPGEQEQARLARVQQVLDGLLQALPPTAPELTTVLRRLGDRSVASAPLPQLAGFLVGLAADESSDEL